MITGFNTDVIYEGVTYHVQTEDKGLATPLILSLVYDQGTILASKRSPYDDLLEGEFDDKVLAERLQRQHKLICAAIKSGRIEDLKRMTAKESAPAEVTSEKTEDTQIEPSRMETPISVLNNVRYETLKMPKFSDAEIYEYLEEVTIEDSIVEIIEEDPIRIDEIIEEIYVQEVLEAVVSPPLLNAIKEEFVTVENIETTIDETIDLFELETKRIPMPVDGLPQIVSTIVAQEAILPEEAVAIVSQNIAEPKLASNELCIRLVDEPEFFGGDRRTLHVSIHRGNNPSGLANAHVIIKILGSTFRPMIFHAKTGPDGLAVVHMQFPSFKAGRAVLLIRALHDGDETEVRHPIGQGGTPVAW